MEENGWRGGEGWRVWKGTWGEEERRDGEERLKQGAKGGRVGRGASGMES